MSKKHKDWPLQQTIPQALLAHVNFPLGSLSTGEPCTCQEDFKKLKKIESGCGHSADVDSLPSFRPDGGGQKLWYPSLSCNFVLISSRWNLWYTVVLSHPFSKDTFETTYYHQTVCKFAFEICFGESIKYYDIDHSTLPLKLFATRLGDSETHSSFMILRQSTSL